MRRKSGPVELEGVRVLRHAGQHPQLSFYRDPEWRKIVGLLPRPPHDNVALRREIDAAIFALHVYEHVPLGEDLKRLRAVLAELQSVWDAKERLSAETVSAVRELEERLQADIQSLERMKRRPQANDPLFADFVDVLIEVWMWHGGYPSQAPGGPLARFLTAATTPVRRHTKSQLVRAVRRYRQRHVAN